MECNNILVAAEVGTTGTLNLSGSNTYLQASTLKLGDVGVSATSTITASDGEFQIHEIVSDADSATESFHLNGAVLKLRKINSATGYDDAVALIAPGVLTWTNAPAGTGRDPADAHLFWTNDVDSVLMVDTNGTHYNYMWAEAHVPVPPGPTEEPTITSSVSDGSLIMSWDDGFSYSVMTNADLLNTNGWGAVATDAASPATNMIGSEPELFFQLEFE